MGDFRHEDGNEIQSLRDISSSVQQYHHNRLHIDASVVAENRKAKCILMNRAVLCMV